MKNKILTLCIIHNDTHVLLGMKKPGFGKGKWNGYGGKVEDDESLEESIMREVFEESGLTVSLNRANKKGILIFLHEIEKLPLKVHIYSTAEFKGKVIETNEMSSKWFLHDDIPYADMWEDNKQWLPLLLDGKKFKGSYKFDVNYKIIESNLHIVKSI